MLLNGHIYIQQNKHQTYSLLCDQSNKISISQINIELNEICCTINMSVTGNEEILITNDRNEFLCVHFSNMPGLI